MKRTQSIIGIIMAGTLLSTIEAQEVTIWPPQPVTVKPTTPATVKPDTGLVGTGPISGGVAGGLDNALTVPNAKALEPARVESPIVIKPDDRFMSDDQFQRAIRGEGKNRWVYIMDWGFTLTPRDNQVPGITLISPEAYLAFRAETARKQFLEYVPTDEDKRQALTVFAKGSAGKTLRDGCVSITRMVLLSDPLGSVKAESYTSEAIPQTWKNALGNSVTCYNLRSRFSMDEVQRVKDAAPNGEFLVAVFSESGTKMYKVKKKHQSHLF